jgi:NAD dependent epimerase/dehydratase family enzyme
LTETIAQMHNPPALFICASGINFYGPNTFDQLVDERNPSGLPIFIFITLILKKETLDS